MSKYGPGDRFQYEGSEPTQAERDEAEMRVARAEELAEHLSEATRTVARELASLKLLDPKAIPNCDTQAELIEAAVEEAEALFNRLLDKGALKDAIATRDYEP